MTEEIDGEIVEREPGTAMVSVDNRTPVGLPPGSTQGLSELQLTPEAIAVLRAKVDLDTEVEIMEDGVVYVPGVSIRKRLDAAVGPGKWALRAESPPFYDKESEECCYDGSLWVQGKYVARCVGGCRWIPKNKRMKKTAAIEGAKTDCLRRCAKDLGIASELWTPAWIRQWKAANALRREVVDGNGKLVTRWYKRGVKPELKPREYLVGEFPSGFGPDSVLPEGNQAGTMLKDLPSEFLAKMVVKTRDKEWRLAAKAEVERRSREAEKEVSEMQPEEDEGRDE